MYIKASGIMDDGDYCAAIAARMREHRTKASFVFVFRNQVLPGIRAEYEQDRRVDSVARATAWNNLTDALVTAGKLPKCARDWSCPFDLRKP